MDLRAISKGLGTLDREVFEAVAESPSPLLDSVMPRLSRAADHSKLWFAIAAGMGAFGSQSVRRGAARGVVQLGRGEGAVVRGDPEVTGLPEAVEGGLGDAAHDREARGDRERGGHGARLRRSGAYHP